MINTNRKFMELAIAEALKARRAGDYGIGAVVVKGDEIIARASSRTKRDEDPVAHAEVVAIRKAAKKLGRRHLKGCVLYTTNEPCPMCTAACVWAWMKGVVYGATIKDMAEFRAKNGNEKWLWRTIDILSDEIAQKGIPKLEIVKEFMREECVKLFHS